MTTGRFPYSVPVRSFFIIIAFSGTFWKKSMTICTLKERQKVLIRNYEKVVSYF